MRAREVEASPQRGTPVANCCHADLLAAEAHWTTQGCRCRVAVLQWQTAVTQGRFQQKLTGVAAVPHGQAPSVRRQQVILLEDLHVRMDV